MQVSLVKDNRYQAGHVFIKVEGCADPGANAFFSLCRASDRMYLSQDARWLNNVEKIPVTEGIYKDNTYYIALDPRLLGELDTLDAHQFALNGANPVRLAIPANMPAGYIPTASTGSMPGMAAAKIAPEPASQSREPEKAPEPTLQSRESEKAPEPEQACEDTPADESLTLETPPTRQPKSSKTGLIVGIAVLLLLILGAALYFLVLKDKGGQESAPVTPPAAEEPAPAPAPSPAESAPAAQPETQPARSVPFINTAREHLKGSADPAQGLALAKPMRTADADADTSDGAFLLLEDAAQKGEPEAMYLLAQFFDPACALPRGTIIPDVAQAVDWYRKAAQHGVTEADTALATLKTSLEQKAANGDAEAQSQLGLF